METRSCLLEATVVSGFEYVAAEECQEKLGIDAKIQRGRIFIETPISEALNAVYLKCVDNLYVIIKEEDISFSTDKECLDNLAALCSTTDWSTGLEVWRRYMTYPYSVQQIINQSNTGIADCLDFPPKFRVTCYRSGSNHRFSSMEAASQLGGRINDTFHWPVKMTDFNIEVVISINNEKVYIGLALTKQSLHKRNITHFGPTTLRSTIAHNMLRLCQIEMGDVVCDPLCGGGTIPLEAAINWPHTLNICGDIHEQALTRTWENVECLNKERNLSNQEKLNIDVFHWDCSHMPFKSNSIDVFISDLPFGKRCGSKFDNRVLYKYVLLEMARCCKLRRGRAVLLTQDKRTIIKLLSTPVMHRLWKKCHVNWVNVGGLNAAVYLLKRTKTTFVLPIKQ